MEVPKREAESWFNLLLVGVVAKLESCLLLTFNHCTLAGPGQSASMPLAWSITLRRFHLSWPEMKSSQVTEMISGLRWNHLRLGVFKNNHLRLCLRFSGYAYALARVHNQFKNKDITNNQFFKNKDISEYRHAPLCGHYLITLDLISLVGTTPKPNSILSPLLLVQVPASIPVTEETWKECKSKWHK